MKNFILILTLVFLSQTTLVSQSHRCGDHMYKEHLENKYPGIQEHYSYNNKVKENYTRNDIVYKIPVVVHIVYNKPEENLPDEFIMDQIHYLNEDFRRTTADTVLTREVFQDVAGDTGIEFYLAEIDPNGNPTNGITRTLTDTTSFMSLDAIDLFDNLDNIKSSSTGGIDPWDQSKYLNIWVGNMDITFFGQTFPFLLGFAYPPVDAPNWPLEELPMNFQENDGVVLAYQAFGRNNPAGGGILEGLNDQGRTLTHEVGHYLGLRHVWGDGECEEDDGMEDTPPMSQSSQVTFSVECSALYTNNTCMAMTDDLPDMVENYMDYSPEKCQNVFTNDQIDLMRTILVGSRSELAEAQTVSVTDEFDEQYRFYPNPAKGFLIFEIESNEDYNLTLSDMNGRQTRFDNLISGAKVDVTGLSGIFSAQICNTAGECDVKKIVIMN